MGLLIEGKWHDRWYDTKDNNGEFIREDSQFRSWITPDGSAGPTGIAGFPAEPNFSTIQRYFRKNNKQN